METLNLILASSIVAGVVSTIVSYVISVRLKNLDFKNEYYKEILKKRLLTYEYVEAQLSILKSVVVGDDTKAYHLIFAYGEEKFIESQKNLFLAVNKNLWVDDATSNILEQLNDLFFSLNLKVQDQNQEQMIEIGKQYYKKISDLRFELENSTKQGLYNLHNMKKAFKPRKANQARYIREQ